MLISQAHEENAQPGSLAKAIVICDVLPQHPTIHRRVQSRRQQECTAQFPIAHIPRPSASATQLRTHSHNELASSITPNSTDPSRNRSGTSPAMLKQASSPARHTPSHSETLPLTPTQNSVRPQGIRGGGVWELDKETYIGPPSEYARFPPPPVPPKEPPEKQTTTPTTTTPTSHSRRLPFGILSHKHSDHNTNPNHKRNISMSSIGAKV